MIIHHGARRGRRWTNHSENLDRQTPCPWRSSATTTHHVPELATSHNGWQFEADRKATAAKQTNKSMGTKAAKTRKTEYLMKRWAPARERCGDGLEAMMNDEIRHPASIRHEAPATPRPQPPLASATLKHSHCEATGTRSKAAEVELK